MIKKYVAIVALTVSAILFLPATLFAKGTVIGYAAGWEPAPTAAQLDRVTHVMLMQLEPLANGTLRNPYDYSTGLGGWINNFVTAAHAKGVKVSIAIGGGGLSANFATATNNTNRANLVASIKKYVEDRNLDGVDIDWEFPVGDVQWGQCMSLLEDLKAAMPCKRISIAIGGDSPNPQFTNHFNMATRSIVQTRIWAADAVHLMTYDMQGVTRPVTWTTHSDVNASKRCIDDWAIFGSGQPGFDKTKLLIGCAFYGYNSATGWTSIMYRDGGGVGCDNATTLGQKVDYTHDNEYGGVIIWELAYDRNIATTPDLLSPLWNANVAKGGYSIIKIDTQPEDFTVVKLGEISGALNIAASTKEGCVNQLTYQWYGNTTDSNTGGTAITGATNASFAIPTSLAEGTHYYYCVVRTTSSKVNPVTSNVAAVVVSSTVVIPVITIDGHPAASTTVRQNNISGNLEVSASVTEGALRYQWYSNATNSNTGGTQVTGATGAVFAIPTALTAGTYYYFCEVSAPGASVRSNVAMVTVEPPVVPIITILTHPAPLTVFERGSISGSLSVSASATENATLSYQWYSNTANNNTGGTAITGANNAVFTIPTTLGNGTYYYFCAVSAPNGATPVRSGVATVTVINNANNTTVITISQQPVSATVTEGSISGNLSVTATANRGTLTYQWYYNTSNSSTGGTAITGATNAAFAIPTNLTAGTYYYYCILNSTTAAPNPVPTVAATVIVNQGVTAPSVITIDTQPAASTSVTEGSISGSLTISASATEGATVSYQWFSNTTNSNTGGKPETNGENFVIPTTLTAGTYYYYCMVSATGGAISVTSNVASVSVADCKPTAEIISDSPTNVLTCIDTEINLTATGGVTYSWDNGLGNNANATATAPGTYTVTVTAANGCSATASVTVTENKTIPTVNKPADQIKCNGAVTDAVNFTGNIPSGVTYSWTNSNTAIGLAANGIGNIMAFVATNSANVPIIGTFTVTPEANGCSGTPVSFTVTVNPTPVVEIVNNTGTTELTCATPVISLTATGGVSYDWGVGGIDADVWVNAAGTYTVTVTATSGCTNTASITISADPSVLTVSFESNGGSEVSDKTACPNNTITKPSPDPTRLGYNFAEWYLEENIFNFDTPVTANITLRAEWSVINYNIYYLLDGGVNHTDNPSTYNIESNTITLQNPTKDNYSFVGWIEGNEIPAGSTEAKTFTAQWTPLTGVAEVSAIAAIKVYPNPAATELYIKLPVKETTDYVIFNYTGQTVMQGKLQDNSTINVQSLPAGIYYLRISGETVKVIKN